MRLELLSELRSAILDEQMRLREADKDYHPSDVMPAINAAMKNRPELFKRACDEEPHHRFQHASQVAIWLVDQMSGTK